ncbi:helix-turn-helix transcriptional regulator [Aliarcobacter cryaerophilus]|uniref:helix-turn-helix domain-containing protein n=1 Tax=Aliarcobacter cryaerophilus TaxID=28198 RepID=UPI003175C98E
MNNKENFIGHDPIDGHKIIVLGELKDQIHPKVEIKRGNEKELREDIGHQILNLGYSYLAHEGGNHIAFCNQKNDKDLYVIEWHYDKDYKQENIVKKVCTELGITQKELAEKLGASEGTVRNWSSSNELPQWALNFIETLIEHKKDKEIVTKFKELLNLIK